MEELPSFYSWLIDRYGKSDSPEGDLASDAARDKSFPRNTSDCQQIISYMLEKKACREAIEVFKDCWCEYMGTIDRIRYKGQ